jgi:hypothetical protein
VGKPSLCEHIENLPTKLPNVGKVAPEGYLSVDDSRTMRSVAGKPELENDTAQEHIQSHQRIESRDCVHKHERGDWFYGRVSNAYREGYDRIFGKQDIFKNLKKE